MTVVTLKEFAGEMDDAIEDFKKKWFEKHQTSPEDYPLELPENNSGLWLEFFINFIESGEV